jgi:hypothetical protein
MLHDPRFLVSILELTGHESNGIFIGFLSPAIDVPNVTVLLLTNSPESLL